MHVRIRVTTEIREHNQWHPNDRRIPAGTEVDAFIDDSHTAWAPYDGQTFAVFASEYEIVAATV